MKKVLIANRGEIAVRIIRACQELNLKTVAVYSRVDKDSLHTRLADESICIGPGPAINSYLSIPALMSAAEVSGVDAIHPGYGFLAESSEFAEICHRYGINFIGPGASLIRRLGNKVEARRIAEKAGVPMFPGSGGVVQDPDHARQVAAQIGFPLIIKAAAGGGGRGMKIVREPGDLERQFHLARTEAEAGFNNPDVFIERFCQTPRHVEVQVIGDRLGNIIHLGERDCSIQRRFQKLIEESPCPVMSGDMRRKIGETAVRLCREAGYDSAGTVEFLLDGDDRFYFMEVNTRIQVEHPVTELVCDFDLVKEQIRVAMGKRLSIGQDDVAIKGHAIECRINAEDPVTFAPWPGPVRDLHLPGGPGIRVDTMLYSGYVVPSLYDSLICKLLAWGRDREEARVRLRRALKELKIDGIRTNTAFHLRVLDDPGFRRGEFTTRFLDHFLVAS